MEKFDSAEYAEKKAEIIKKLNNIKWRGVVLKLEIAKDFSKKVWLSWTTRGNKLNRLPSTELLHDAILKSIDLDIDCQLVNCVHADTATLAINRLKKEKATTITNYFLGKFKNDLSFQNRFLRYISEKN